MKTCSDTTYTNSRTSTITPTDALLQSDVADHIELLLKEAESGEMERAYELRFCEPEILYVKTKCGVQLLFNFSETKSKQQCQRFSKLLPAVTASIRIAEQSNCEVKLFKVWFDKGLLAGSPAFERQLY
ncbi:MAG: hypothetical protein WCO60_10895 [Verrucomicrobiota bacterium]